LSGHVFQPKNTRDMQSRIRPWQENRYSAKEYIHVWLVIHYLDFDSVAPYYVCSPQLEFVN